MKIVAMDTDVLASDTTKTAPITWISAGFIEKRAMNATATTTGGWADSAMRTYMRETLFPKIEQTVRLNIKEVNKTYKSVTPTNGVLTATDTVWIPSSREIFGGTTYEDNGPIYSSVFDSAANRIKKEGGYGLGSANNWWLRSASNTSGFRYVYGDGNEYSNSANYICKEEFRVERYDDEGRGTDKYMTIGVGSRFETVDTSFRLAGGPDTIRLEDKNRRFLELLPETIDAYFDWKLEPSDFKVGAKAYVISKGGIAAVEISSVGRKYVYVKGGHYGYYHRNEEDNFFVENKDWGEPEELYLTMKDAEDELEFSMLLTSIRRCCEFSRLKKLSLDQLRRIGKIFEE